MPSPAAPIAEPMTLDFGAVPVPSPLFTVQQPYRPVSRPVDRGGWTVRHTDYYDEIAIQLSDGLSSAVFYVMPVSEEAWLVACSLGPAFEPMFRLMTGRTHGERVAPLVRQHWPDVWQMLRRSNEMQGGRVLMRLHMGPDEQWIVADLVSTEAVADMSPGSLEDLLVAALSVMVRAGNPVVHLPGLFAHLAASGVGHSTSALLADIFGHAADVGEAFFEDRSTTMPADLMAVVLEQMNG